MAIFQYKAIGKNGKATKGVIDADSPADARRKLREQDLFPTDIEEATGSNQRLTVLARKAEDAAAMDATEGGGFQLGRVSVRDIALITRQFAVLLHAGMPLVEALTALLDQTSKPRLKRAIYDVRDKVKSGSTLADALARHPRIFSQLYCNMVGAGETSGALEQVLLRLADIEERQARLRARIISTLTYPLFVAIFAAGLITFLMLVIVPKLTQIFTRQGQELPAITNVMIGTSRFIGHWWWLIILVLIGLFALWRFWVSTASGRMRWDRIKLKMPLYGALQSKLVAARFARTLGTMLESGLTMMKALDVVKTIIGNSVIEESMSDVKAGVRRGKDLARPLKETGLFPPLLIHMIDLGQRSGEMESMLLKVADTYDEDVSLAVDALVGMLEPVIIIVMGLFVGFLVLSILLPILTMSKNI